MSNDLIKTFTPLNDVGREDTRFTEDLREIFREVRPEVMKGLIEFKEKTTDLENQYGSLAYELCMCFIRRIDEIDELERGQDSNKFRWRTKKLRSQLTEGLKERGFKPSNVTKMIGAAEYVHNLKSKGRFQVYDFVKALPISSQYLMSGLNEIGITKAMSYEEDTKQWDPKTDTFIGKSLTQKAIEEIKREHPKNPEETRGKNKLSSKLNILEDDPSTTEVILERSKEDMTQLELIDELVQIVSHLEFDRIYKDKEIIERLSIVSTDLWGVAHLSKHPVNV